MKLKGKVAIVTGGSQGIGGAIATRFAREGANLVIAARTLEVLERKKSELEEIGVEVLAVSADVSNEDDVKLIVSRTIERFGKVDILVNAAGISMAVPSEELSLENWNKCMNINSTGTFLMCREVAKEMIKANSGGKIINITSIVAHAGIPKRAAYAASKGAVRQLTETLALEWGKYNIQVNAISPGYVKTEMFMKLAKQGIHNIEALEERIPAGRMATPDDMAGPAVFLASSDSDYVTGVIMKVDGGWLVNGHLKANQ